MRRPAYVKPGEHDRARWHALAGIDRMVRNYRQDIALIDWREKTAQPFSHDGKLRALYERRIAELATARRFITLETL
jgi:hypothetical protein